MHKKYFKHFIDNIADKYYYSLYKISIFIAYISVILFGIYFVNLAFDKAIIANSLNILCFNCIEYNKIIINILIYIFSLNITFYLINEIRFRIIKVKKIRNIKYGNEITYFLTILIPTILYILL